MNGLTTLVDPILRELPIPLERTIKPPQDFSLPEGTRIVSADNHSDVAEDIYVERLPDELKAEAPRVWVDKFTKVGFDDGSGELRTPFVGDLLERILVAANGLPGSYDMAQREASPGCRGNPGRTQFPNVLLFLFGHPNLRLREEVFRVYNRYLSNLTEAMDGRSHGVEIVPNWWIRTRPKARSARWPI